MRTTVIAACLAFAMAASAQTTRYGDPNFDLATDMQSGNMPEVMTISSGDVGYAYDGSGVEIPFTIDQPATVWLAVYSKDANPQYDGPFQTGGGPGGALTRAAGIDTIIYISTGQDFTAGSHSFAWDGNDFNGNAVSGNMQNTFFLFAINGEATPTWMGAGYGPWNGNRIDTRKDPPEFWYLNQNGPEIAKNADGDPVASNAVNFSVLGQNLIENPEGITTMEINWHNVNRGDLPTDWRDMLDVHFDPTDPTVLFFTGWQSIPGVQRAIYDEEAQTVLPDESGWPNADIGWIATEPRSGHLGGTAMFHHPWVEDDGILYNTFYDNQEPLQPGITKYDRDTGEVIEFIDYSDVYLTENEDGTFTRNGPAGLDMDETGVYTSGYWTTYPASFPVKATYDGDILWINGNGDGFIDRYQGDEAVALGLDPNQYLVNFHTRVSKWGISLWGGYNNPQWGIVLGPDGAGLFNINLDRMPSELPGQVTWWDTDSELDGLHIQVGYGGRMVHWPMDVTTGTIAEGLETAVAEIAEEGTPDDFALDGNYPNPFNAETAIRFSIPQMGEVLPARLVIYNAAGQEVLSLLEGEYGAGHYEVKWDGRDAQGNPVSTGVYSYRLTVGDRFTETSQMTLLK